MSHYRYNRQVSPPAPFVYVSVCAAVEGTAAAECPAQLDTAADLTVIPSRLVEELQLDQQVGCVAKTHRDAEAVRLPAYAPPLRGPGPARHLPGTKAIRRAHLRLGHAGRQARIVSGCVNSAFSRHFYTFYGPSVQAMATQLGARHRWWTPMIHRGRARRTISAGSRFGQWSPDLPPVLCDRSSPSPQPLARHVETSAQPNGGSRRSSPNESPTVGASPGKPPVGRTAGSGNPFRTSAINPRGKETCVNRNFAACQPPAGPGLIAS